MANAAATNFTLNTSGDVFSAVWKLTRVMLSAGWHYKASGNGQSSGVKDTSGNAALDQWGVDGAVNLQNAGRGTGSGSGVSIAAASATTGIATISGVSGFTSASVGDYLTITGSTAGNNGSFRITAQTGTTVSVYAPQLVAETSNASLSTVEQFGGADGSIGAFSTTTSGQSTLISFTTSSFNGFTTTDVGRMITVLNSSSGNNGTYLIAGFVASNSVLLYAGPGGTPQTVTPNDAGNPTLQWVEYAPLNQLYPSYIQAANGSGAWICLQGPTIMKIPIGSNTPSTSFIRGENITQSTTGAQGELLGYMPDSAGGTGFLVVAPRVVGTGVQASSVATYGWNSSANTDTITGSISGATVTTPASSTPIAYIREFVFWKNNANSGHVYYQVIDQNPSTESQTTASTGRFSTMANTLTQVTSNICPGGSSGGAPSSNGFPTTGTCIVIGNGGSGAATTNPANFCGNFAPPSPGKAHIMVANNIEQQGISQDGSWLYVQSNAGFGYSPLGFQRMDNQEDGDLDPYIIMSPSNSNQTSVSRTQRNGSASANTNYDNCNSNYSAFNSGGFSTFIGFRRRGLVGGPGESFQVFTMAFLADPSQTWVINCNSGYPDSIATAPVSTTNPGEILVYNVREPIWIVAGTQSGFLRMRKGTLRWIMTCQGLSVNQTTDNLKWICLSPESFQFIAGPWDGVTTPTF
jgi:hypothetical protein